MAKLIEIEAVFVRERQRFANADGDVIIGDVKIVKRDEQPSDDLFDEEVEDSFAVKGKAEVDELQPHQTYRFYGNWTNHPKYGRQFHFRTFVRSQPHGRAGVIGYLKQAGKGNGIGQGRALALWNKFGSDAVRVLREDPEVASVAISGLSLESAEAASKWLIEEQSLEDCMIEVVDLFDGRGFPKNTARAAIREWGNRAAEVIRRDPFSLMIFTGCGFKLCDKTWISLGLPPGRLRRQAYCAWYLCKSNSDSHVWFTAETIVEKLTALIGERDVRPVAAIKLAKRISRMSINRMGALTTIRTNGDSIAENGSQVYIAESRKAWQESRLARLLVDSLKEPNRWPSVDSLKHIDEHQRERLRSALQGSIAMLGGSPGTGKTFTAAALIAKLIEVFGVNEIAVGAPTGKAAVRLTEALDANGIKLRARTWHSLLGIGMQPGEFRHNEADPLPFKVLVADESSMLDLGLMCAIFRARAAGTLVLFVGDINQLPPVGSGAPLRDLIAAGIPYGELTEIKRNSGGIVEACAAIRDGKPWKAGDNLRVIGTSKPEDTIREMLRVIRAESNDLDPVWDCQVVVAVNAKSPLSRKQINDILQKELNKNEPIKGSPFRLADKVVNVANGYFSQIGGPTQEEIDEAIERGDDVDFSKAGEAYVANGELAELTSAEPRLMIAKLTSPDRTIRIPRGKQENKASDDSESEEVSTGCSFELAYGLSVHKSQGSEFPVVIIPIDEYPGAKRVCSREWLYTAISRAKVRCYVIGNKATADKFCRNQAITKRKTFLRELICKFQNDDVMVNL